MSKGGGSTTSTPVQTPDSLHSIAYMRALDLVSEGEIVGLVNGLQSVYFDRTPLQNPDGTLNYQNVTVDVRTGTQDQDYISGFPSVENEIAANVALTSVAPWVQAISDLELSAVRIRLSVDQLQADDSTTGAITGYRIEYAIDVSTDNAAFIQVLDTAFDGKTTSKYERSHRIELPAANLGWSIRVRRLTPNQNSALIADAVAIESYTEVIDAKLRYPMSAVIGVQVDASQFSSVPTRAYHLRGRIMRVPTNYDPERRVYSGIWDGTFKLAWTNNPAWVFYDVVLNDRYGLGSRVNANMIDKWSLYQIGQYCDGMVPDGKGGMEPRFTCNVYFQTRDDAYKVLQDLASVFRGLAYWGSTPDAEMPSIMAVADRPQDVAYTYSPANVIGGKFTYQGSALNTRYTVALVSWSDPSDFYAQKVEYVPDPEGIARYGILQTEITAIGCTSQGQAQRIGNMTLLTSRLETEGVAFSVGLDGTLAAPGQVIAIADPKKAGRPLGGRLHAVNGRTVILDRDTPVQIGSTLRVNLPSGVTESQIVSCVSGRAITVAVDWSSEPVAEAGWVLDSPDLYTQLFRVMTVVEGDGLAHNITAVQYQPEKFDAADFGTLIDPRPTTVIPPSVQTPPANVSLTTYTRIDQGMAVTVMVIAWAAAASAVSYQVEWRKDNGDWILAGNTGSVNFEVSGIYTGVYTARVRASNPLGIQSLAAYSVDTQLTGKAGSPPALTTLTATSLVFSIRLDWGFPAGAEDTQRTEIWSGAVDVLESATKLADFSYPQNTHTMSGLAAGVSFFFWGRLVDKTGNIGPWYPISTTGGVNGQSGSDAGPILGYLTGQITEGELYKDLASRIDLIDAPASVPGSVAARVSTESKMRAEADGALATQVTDVQAQLGTTNAAVQTNASAIAGTNGQLSAMYTIKTQVAENGHTYTAGIGIGVVNHDGITESQFLVSASTFAVLDPAGSALASPFVIRDGQVFIDQAFIGTAWIENEMIGDIIQSKTLGANGQPRWRLDKNGTLTLNGANGGSGYMTLNDSALVVYDGAGTLRVRVGMW